MAVDEIVSRKKYLQQISDFHSEPSNNDITNVSDSKSITKLLFSERYQTWTFNVGGRVPMFSNNDSNHKILSSLIQRFLLCNRIQNNTQNLAFIRLKNCLLLFWWLTYKWKTGNNIIVKP